MTEMEDFAAVREFAPFWVRRPGLLMRGLQANRDAPDLEALSALAPAERFVWGILPHAARSFAPCILALPARLALPAALGYLYCRVLDTYEDLVQDRLRRFEALALLPERLGAIRRGAHVEECPAQEYTCRDRRDEAHALLAREVGRLDQLFREMDEPVQEILLDLVRDMSEGMRWAGWVLDEQGGALKDAKQLRTYCEAVLGNPIRFAARLFSWGRGKGVVLPRGVETAAMDVGEFLQLANITRDIEKDLARGVSYHPKLAGDVRGLGADGGAMRILAARSVLVDRALSLSPAYLELVDGLKLRAGWLSASALLMLRFTERYYVSCAAQVGVSAPSRPSPGRLVVGSWPALFSGGWARRRMGREIEALVALRQELPLQASSMYLS